MKRSKACLKKLRQLNALPSQTWCGYISQITQIIKEENTQQNMENEQPWHFVCHFIYRGDTSHSTTYPI
jgi:hypothetical protein